MVIVAVAGGTGNVGRTIVEVLLQSDEHQVIVLSRGDNSSSEGVLVLKVDYADVYVTTQLLKQHGVHTIISALQITDQISSAAQVNLIKAADLSSSVKRFIASGWGAIPNEQSPMMSLQNASNDELRKTKLEWTRFAVGFFSDYYAIPYIKTHLPPMSFAVDMTSRKAAIPGTGEEPMAFIYSYDMAKFVKAFLDVNDWNETTFCYGEKITWNAFIQTAEEITGTPFEVVYDSAEKLANFQVTELPSHKYEHAASKMPKAVARQLLALLGHWTTEGQFDIPIEKSLNRRFLDIKPLTIRDVLLCRKVD